MEQWSVRSAGHADAHYGPLDSRTGIVTARCGQVFTPEPALFGHGPATLHPPLDPARCCPGGAARPGSGERPPAGRRWNHARLRRRRDTARGCRPTTLVPLVLLPFSTTVLRPRLAVTNPSDLSSEMARWAVPADT
jgi:hypothetical protein